VTALDLAREHMSRTGLDGYTLSVLMECEPACWTPAPCPSCGRPLTPRGRDAGLANYGAYCCDEAQRDPAVNKRHLWSETDGARTYTDLLFDLRERAGEFNERDDDE
jgi:hypothetical protein